jgi:hypothetical protein
MPLWLSRRGNRTGEEGGRTGKVKAGAEGRGWKDGSDGAEIANGAEESGLAAGLRTESG